MKLIGVLLLFIIPLISAQAKADDNKAPGVPIIQCFQVDELGLAIGPLLNSIQLTTADQVDLISKIPPAVSVGNRGHLSLLISVNKRIVSVKLMPLAPHVSRLEHLLAEVVVDECRLQSQVARAVQVGAF